MRKPTQYQIFYAEQRKLGDRNIQFLEMVKDGLTREELQALINKRPAYYGMYENWLDKLPSSTPTTQQPNERRLS